MYIYYIEKEYQRKMDSIYSANNVTIEENVFFEYSSNSALEDLFKWREKSSNCTLARFGL